MDGDDIEDDDQPADGDEVADGDDAESSSSSGCQTTSPSTLFIALLLSVVIFRRRYVLGNE